MTTYSDGPGGTITTAIDTYVDSANPTNNYGTRANLLTGTTSKGLLRFNLSAIPSGASCQGGTLYLYHASSATASAFTLTAYSVGSANYAWTEGTASNTQAASGEPCWNALAADGSGGVTTAWAGTAGLGTSGTDYEATAMGTANGNRSDALGTEYAISLNTTRLSGWFGTANTNYGLLVTTSAASGNIASSDHGTAAWRPNLVVTYTDNSSPTVALSTAAGTSTASAYLEVGVVRLQLGESLTPAGTMHAGQQLMTPAGSMRRVREVA